MKSLLLYFGIFLFLGCATSIQTYENEKPRLILENYFNGKLIAHGLVMNRSGQVMRRFTVDMNTIWKGNVGTLTENFTWNNNEQTQRVWTVTKKADGTYEGSAADILDVAYGESAGNAFHWSYKMDLPVKDTTYHVHFNDWMYLVTDKVLINKADITWFGIHAGQVIISFTKE